MPDDADASRRAALAQFHAAEYSALMSRISLWTTLQYQTWPIVILVYGVLASLKGLPTTLLEWFAGLAVPVAYVAFQRAMVDGLESVLMIETRLRPVASDLAGTEAFWFHERFHRRVPRSKRGLDVAFWWLWPPLNTLVWSIGTFIFIRLYRSSFEWKPLYLAWNMFDYLYLLACLAVAGTVIAITSQGRKLEKQIDAAIDRQRRADATELRSVMKRVDKRRLHNPA
jgi:hypothetical protein